MSGEAPSPYAPPASELGTRATEQTLASRGQRLANSLIDGVATFLLNSLNGLWLVLAGLRLGFLGRLALANLTILVYYFALEAWSGRTLGKLVTGTRVVSENGRDLTLARVMGRTLARLIPFEAFSFVSDERPVGWHDDLSGTRVIRTR